jgi:urea transport system ATP-binding protein
MSVFSFSSGDAVSAATHGCARTPPLASRDPGNPLAAHTHDASHAGAARALLGGGVGRGAKPPSEGSGAIVYLEDVSVDYDGFMALKHVNFYMDRRELRVVIGPNGAGKTTLLDVISGRVKPSGGRVIFGHHTDLVALRENEIAALGVGRKFQTPSIFVNLTVRDNVELSLRRPSKGVFATLLDRGGPGERERTDGVLEAIGLSDRAGWRAGALSHGEKQWLEIGMVMAQEPELLLVDEPVAGMTDEETVRTGELLEAIARERSVLVIEHDMEFVRQIARKVTVLHQGGVLCEGSVEQVQRDPRVREVYLGQRTAHEAGQTTGDPAVARG